MREPTPTVFVVDDDDAVRRGLERRLRSFGLEVVTCASGAALLERVPLPHPGCIVLDLQMPGASGLDVQEDLEAAGVDLPVIFLTGHGTVSSGVVAMKRGAVDFLEKPVDESELLGAIERAIELSLHHKASREEAVTLTEQINRLTTREEEVFRLVASGMRNRQAAAELGISEKTVKVHRASVMQKLDAESLADLVRLAERLRQLAVDPPSPPAT